jgi:hypothetical protein
MCNKDCVPYGRATTLDAPRQAEDDKRAPPLDNIDSNSLGPDAETARKTMN